MRYKQTVTYGLVLAILALAAVAWPAAAPAAKPRSTWPQPYAVERNEAVGTLTLGTPYYTIEHDLKRGGAISRIALTHGRAANLLVTPLASRLRGEDGEAVTDLGDPAPKITHRRAGPNEIVTVDAALAGPGGRSSGLRLRSTYEYRWGYVKIRKEFILPEGGAALRELCPLTAVLSPSLTGYGYREGKSEAEGAEAFSFGSNIWGRLRPGQADGRALKTNFVPRSMIFLDPGVEGLEWFVGSDLAPWELGPASRRGRGLCALVPSVDPAGLAISVSPLWSKDEAVPVSSNCAFDYYLAVPLNKGHAFKPWIHTSFNRNKGNWLSAEEVRQYAAKGYETLHCHNDGDYHGDGLFWRDGAYPPYPDMDRYDEVLGNLRRAGIRTATYFSNKELHPSTPEFKASGEAWGRRDRSGTLRHTYFKKDSEFGVLMCLRSGWLDYFKQSVDRVLKNHPLDGVYYDWNAALYCENPLHEGKAAGEKAAGHWDMDELLDLMEWTRQRVGPDGLLIIHNTTVPMFVAENFADYVVATEWGYQKWTEGAPELESLPLEWNLAGARPRGVISYGSIEEKAPRRLHRLFALEAMLGGVATWPASPEILELKELLRPLGDIESYRFTDWRNGAVSLSDPACGAAVYSRPGEAYLLLANLEGTAREVTCRLLPENLPIPLPTVSKAEVAASNPAPAGDPDFPSGRLLDAAALAGSGIKITIPGDGAVVIRIR